jgi:uncharacterized membrane-anchored protein
MSLDPIPEALPPDDAQRATLHNEVHARPSPRVQLPALVVCLGVLNDGVSREAELEHLRQLPGHPALNAAEAASSFLLLDLPGGQLQWERHTEFTRYTLIQPLPPQAGLEAAEPELLGSLVVPTGWWRRVPGRTLVAIKQVMLENDIRDPDATLSAGRRWLSQASVVASMIGRVGRTEAKPDSSGAHTCAVTDFRLRPSGFERMLLVCEPGTTPTRAGRVSQRLMELETYRLMALRGLPVAKELAPTLGQAERELAQITAQLEDTRVSDQELLDRLTVLAARVERATAEHGYRFSATQAYHGIVQQRIGELRERPIPGTQTIGEFMQRRLSPAMATVASTAQRLSSLSQRIERAGALLRTRVDIATEAQNQQLLAKLTRGQELQLKLQSTVEGLSIAAISYYVISLLQYAAKAVQKAGVPIQPEVTAGLAIPLVLWAVWRTVRRIHDRIHERGA